VEVQNVLKKDTGCDDVTKVLLRFQGHVTKVLLRLQGHTEYDA